VFDFKAYEDIIFDIWLYAQNQCNEMQICPANGVEVFYTPNHTFVLFGRR